MSIKAIFRAMLMCSSGNENIWIRDFDPDQMVGYLDNIPLCKCYKLNDKVKIRMMEENGLKWFEIIEKVKNI